MTCNIAILEPGYADYSAETAVVAKLGGKVVAVPADTDAAPILREVDPIAILARERRVTLKEISQSPGLRVIVRYGVGVDSIDLEAASERRIYVANVPDYGAEHEVSDHALALYLAVRRRLVERDHEVRQGQWGIGQRRPIPGHLGGTLGLVGFGRIGQRTAHKFKALGFTRVLVVDPRASAPLLRDHGAESVTLETLCRQADVISLHAPLTQSTRHLIGREQLALMRPTTVVINVSRGGLLDEEALADALTQQRLFGAGIDVFETEPVTDDNPLLTAPNTILSDHAAWYSERSVKLIQQNAATEIARVLKGMPPRNWVNRWQD